MFLGGKVMHQAGGVGLAGLAHEEKPNEPAAACTHESRERALMVGEAAMD
jgi:hypothetical protein